jgi:hypothetical protein
MQRLKSRGRRAFAVSLVLAIGVATAGVAAAHDDALLDDGAIDNAKVTHHHHEHQHGDESGHLDPIDQNVELVSKLQLRNAVPEKIADVGVHKGYAYLAAWGVVTCKYNGVHVVDIRDPANPREVAFIGSKEGSFPGEGIQALSINTPQFKGDILVSNNEKCNDKTGFGGLNIYDITKPSSPTPLSEGFGDFTVNGQGKKDANEIHSVFAWQAGNKAYAVIVDNEEGPDVDIVDISNPKKPKLIAEYDLDAMFDIEQDDVLPSLNQIFHHDVVVKEIDGRQIMLVSYWDGGYVKLDVTNPTSATYVADSDFAAIDPQLFEQTGATEVPEGNAHQAEFTTGNHYILAADEDFNPTAFASTSDDGGAFLAIPGDATAPVPVGSTITGQTKYVGRACPGDPAVPAGDGNQIAVVVRGVCTFTEKIAAVEFAGGYQAAIVVNREGSDACGALAMAVEGEIPAVSVQRSVGYDLFDLSGFDEAACLTGTAQDLPGVNIDDTGDTVSLRSYFDGWGYVRLFNNVPGTGKLVELDTYAIPEAMDPAFAEGFGDLSVHEVAVSAVDPSLAYLSYYSGGVRVIRIDNDGIVEVGAFIDEGGNNFWGVQVFQSGGQEYVAASDRDHGLYIFRYTGSN